MNNNIEIDKKLDVLLRNALHRFEHDIINHKIASFNDVFEKEIRTIVDDLYKFSMKSAATNIIAQLGDNMWLKEIIRMLFNIAFDIDIGSSIGLMTARQNQPGAKQIARDLYSTIFLCGLSHVVC